MAKTGESGETVNTEVRISGRDPRPAYLQIEEQLEGLILGGRLLAGTKLPSCRVLARHLDCSVITTRRAYSDLEDEGLIWARQGLGTVVVEMQAGEFEERRKEVVSSALIETLRTGVRLSLSPRQLTEIYETSLEQVLIESTDGSYSRSQDS